MRPALRDILLADRLFPGAYYAADFLKRQFRLNGVRYTRFSDIAGVSIARASQAYAETPWSTLQLFASGVPRITDRGLLVEAAATNLFTYSEDWSQAAWSKTNITATAAAATAPNGTTTATKLEATAAAATICYQAVAVAATTATYSIFVKQGTSATEANRFRVYNQTTATTLLQVLLNYSTGAITYETGASGVTATSMAGGWWRLSMTVTSGVTSGDTIRGYPCFLGASETAGEYAYVWGAQLTAQDHAESYVPTTTASVTRAADVISIGSITGLDYTSGVTLFAEFERASDAGATSYLLHLDDGDTTDRAAIYISSADLAAALTTSGNVQQSGLTVAGALSVGTVYRQALRVSTNSVQLARGGTLGTEDTSCANPATPTAIRIGSDSASGLQGHAYLRKLAVFPTGDADAILQARAYA